MNNENPLRLKDLKALFLDIGGVLLTNGWGSPSRKAAAQKFGFDFDEMEQRHDLAFDTYEQGRISLDDYLNIILFYKDRTFSKDEFRTFLLQQSQKLPHMLEQMIEWKKQHPQLRYFSLNNEPKELHRYRVEQYGLRAFYDGFVCSCDVGLRKPDPKIYELAAAVAGVMPHECLYIDDREVLTAAGKAAGLHVLTHKSPEETLAFLHAL